MPTRVEELTPAPPGAHRRPAVPAGRDPRAGQGHPAGQPAPRHPHHPHEAAARGGRARPLAGPPFGRRGRQEPRGPPPRHLAGPARGEPHQGRLDRALGARRGGGQPHHHRSHPGHRLRRGRQGQVDGHPGDRPQQALEEAGIAAWETDLAELIVQLGHDRPSHILVPAIHRNRTEVRDIFLEEMGRYGTPPPEASTTTPDASPTRPAPTCATSSCARKWPCRGQTSPWPRPGSLVVVESEGNGRMC